MPWVTRVCKHLRRCNAFPSRLSRGIPPTSLLAGPTLLPPAAPVYSQRQPCTPKNATTRGTPAASNASVSKPPSHTHSGPAPASRAAALKYPFSPRAGGRGASPWAPALQYPQRARTGSPGARPVWYAERPRWRRKAAGHVTVVSAQEMSFDSPDTPANAKWRVYGQVAGVEATSRNIE